ncbi:hypothetical protein ABES03_08505 [Neobacillus rhizosphaerae]|uniref:hypothetical protein n=1 Tax=Neobacillus rhizosphaerae TaxID=2880965 RepID=UPI003D2D3B06
MFAGHKATWNIYKPDGELLLQLHCLYDSNDFLSEIAEAWEIDYKNKVIKITRELG